MYDHQVPTPPNRHPPKMNVLPETFIQIILAAKWQVQHSSTVRTFPNQQARPLPSLLFDSYAMLVCLCSGDRVQRADPLVRPGRQPPCPRGCPQHGP